MYNEIECYIMGGMEVGRPQHTVCMRKGNPMDIITVFQLCGGIAFFLYGMNVMSHGLEKMSGGRLESTLRVMTSNPFMGLVLGAGITIAIQSSSAMTVMLVGLVNSGIMEFSQTIGVIMGSNIGTTLTAWLLAMTGIESDNIILRLLKPSSFAPLLAFVGIILNMIGKEGKKRDVGAVLIGFAVLMSGMEVMGDAVEPLAELPQFTAILTMFNNPLLGVLVGTVFTGIIQSSAAAIGILQALSMTGTITFAMAFPLILGLNIGTCVTSLISSIGVSKNAKRVSVVHILFNFIGTIICLVAYYIGVLVIPFDFRDMVINPFGIALCHSLFNILLTIVLFPFGRQLSALACFFVRDKPGDGTEAEQVILDERLLNIPSIAIAECRNKTVRMAHIARDTLISALDTIGNYSESAKELVTRNEDVLDRYEDVLGTYLVKVATLSLSKADSEQVTNLLHTIGDLERIGDHARNIVMSSAEMHEKGISFSDEAKEEISVIADALREILGVTVEAFAYTDLPLAGRVEPLEQVIDKLNDEIKLRHIERLKSGKCTIELGFILSDILASFERVADHCSNMAVTLIQISASALDTHSYLHEVKNVDSTDYDEYLSSFSKKYSLPELHSVNS